MGLYEAPKRLFGGKDHGSRGPCTLECLNRGQGQDDVADGAKSRHQDCLWSSFGARFHPNLRPLQVRGHTVKVVALGDRACEIVLCRLSVSRSGFSCPGKALPRGSDGDHERLELYQTHGFGDHTDT